MLKSEGDEDDDIIEKNRKEFIENNKEFLNIVKKRGKLYRQKKAGQLSLGLKSRKRVLLCGCEVHVDEWSCAICMKCVNCCECK